MAGDCDADRLTRWQRQALRRMRKAARKDGAEPLTSEDWAAYFEVASGGMESALSRLLRALPSSPRCGICGAPFAGFGSRLIRPLGYRQSRKNPNLCATCVEASPPGGMTTDAGVLFADLRGFTRLSEQSDPEAVSVLLRRFYACAEDVLFPEAMIDKLIGDEVMALYLPMYGRFEEPGDDDARTAPRAAGPDRLRQRRGPIRRGRNRPRLRRGLRRQRRQTLAQRLHGDRRRRQRRRAAAGGGERRRDRRLGSARRAARRTARGAAGV